MPDFYSPSGNPVQGADATTPQFRNEFLLVATNISEKLAPYTGNGSKLVAINAGGTKHEAITTTGTGSGVRAISPTFVTPALGTPASGNLTNCTGLPVGSVTGILPTASGGTGIAFFTAAGPTVARVYTFPDQAATMLFSGGALGTPASGVATNLTGTAEGLTAGIANGLKSATTTVVVSAATAPSNGQVLTATGASTANWATPSSAVPLLIRSARTANTILDASDKGTLIDITSGTFTQTFTAAATLASGWWCYIRNSGTGDITLDPNAAELIDGLSSVIMYRGETRLVQCTGTAFFSVLLAIGITLGTPVASTSGTSIDFTGIAANAKNIIISLVSVSTNGTSPILVQLGDAGGIEPTGYESVADNSASSGGTSTAGFILHDAAIAAATYSGRFTLSLENSSNNTWTGQGVLTRYSTGGLWTSGGIKATSAFLDRVRVTTVNGTDTFDAGEINIAYQS